MKKKILLSIVALTTAFACHKNEVTGSNGLNLIPEGELITMSVSEYDKFLAQNPPLPASDERTQLVRRCGVRIQKSVDEYFASQKLGDELKNFQWTFNVVDQNQVNAWCMPGGKVVVYTGLLPVTGDEQSLAVVMGHEIAHAIARHGNQRMSQGLLVQLGGAVLSVALSQKPQMTQQIFQQAYGVSTTLGTLSYSRKHESEADKMGLIFAAMAGYNPEAAIAFWQRMADKKGGQAPPELLSTHPSDAKRIKDLQKFMPEAKKYYKPR
ncbi:MAG: M48 family metallopeptidase [Bacteroidetes bacterium]|nr:M48 family metallopeptidase [Bacteroidota bacterium]